VSIHVALNHVTHYRYDRRVGLSPPIVRLRPAPHCRTRILSYALKVDPEGHFVNWQQDPQSNYLARLTFPDPVEELRIEVNLVAEMAVYNPFDFFLEPHVEQFPFTYEPWQLHELQPFLHKETITPRFSVYLTKVSKGLPTRTIDMLVEVNRRVQSDISYVIRLDPGVQTTEETLERASGSCRDSTWLLVQVLRHLGLAARFVSGYLIQLVPDVAPVVGPAGAPADFTDLHAWCEVYLPGGGWIGLDPTSGLLAGEGHIPLSCTPEPASAAPVTGAVDECETTFTHHMQVQRIHESPRVTKPYSDAQWRAIDAMGHQIDDDLDRLDVRLTMGGEPTFVSNLDRDGAEWNTDALGPTKRLLAADLLWKLRRHFGAWGFVHFGQGKWYPGEQLPRWSIGCYWRTDGEPSWSNPSLFADERRTYGFSSSDAERFARTLAAKLGITDAHIQPGHEDVWYYLWRERRLPINVDPLKTRLDDPLERERLRKIFTQGLDHVVGYVLPLAPEPDGSGRWSTGPWLLRAPHLFLMPGDSPMGYRLPVDSLPWVSTADYPYPRGFDTMEDRAPLPPAVTLAPRMQSPRGEIRDGRLHPLAAAPTAAATDARTPQPDESAAWLVRTALCTEVRNGTLYVFLPPIAALEDYLRLIATIEATAAGLRMPIVLEGYPPPSDPRLQSFSITPDPGVIEVNIQPARTWDELTSNTNILYEEARQTHLSTEKFMMDGRHVGTGGGNHFVLGGATPPDSPFLRRPDLLRSLVSYWHNHPSLSYLFSGLFLGPTSQAPRVDEARHDSVYELELAFAQLPRDESAPPWLVDRVFRHLLTDMTGNTHRAEFSIDKLYSPDGPSGRRGLVELRAFEMPPHARMSLVQQLLLRSLVARFWREPYTAPLVRWGTELHDRFMLPYFVELDFADVLAEQAHAGRALDEAWFAPHFEFRFPASGEVSVRGMHIALRHALEPWHVLGEEGSTGGTVRYVDSSVERLQVLASGLTPDRYTITCNGRALPLQPTGRNGEYVAGVRYRAWQPASCLHPTIPVHAPLTFDIVDTWLSRSLGGCQYHVTHPGGRSYDTFPVNSYEAESRRLSRFSRLGLTPGVVAGVPVHRSREFPYTLDLRTPADA
jgi:uncharacterized protein (DUF2126 family)/transglutaminase-like putative cysteine protease